MPPQGLFHFPGVEQILSGSFTFSHGISPSVAMVEIAPQNSLILTNGTLTLTFGSNFKLQFPGCRVKSPTIRYGLDGRIMAFGIEDRRWKWRYGDVYGRYNIKKSDGTIDTLRSKEKTPQELARILLEAMNEQNYDVSALPNTLRLTREWRGNNPAEELAQLCDELGCRVMLGLDDRVKIITLGQGKDLPINNSRRTTGYGLEINGIPDSLKAVCAPTRWQSKLKLEAVGLDVDGRIKPVDKLSYKPADGWAQHHPEGFFAITNLADRRLALRTVWRWYRIVSQADGSMKPPGVPSDVDVTSIMQFLPISSRCLQEQLDQQTDPQDKQTQHRLPAFVEGAFLKRNFSFGSSLLFTDVKKGATTDSQGNTSIGARYVGGFSIDEERGIVEFSDWVVKRKNGGGYEEADLYLTCSYSILDDDFTPLQFTSEREIVSRKQGTGPRILDAPDITLELIAEYASDGKKIKAAATNETDVRKWTKELIDQAEKEYQAPETEEVEYAGFLRIELDGRIQQVGWEFGKGGAITRASSNTEFDLIVPRFRELREQEKARAIQGKIFREPVVTGAS